MAVCDISIWPLFLGCFLAATLLPGGSEALLFWYLRCHPDQFAAGIIVATIGNTLGGMTSYLIGRLFRSPENFRYIELVRRYGSLSLGLAWLPIIGDLICVTAGWLRINWFWSAIWMAIGKLLRYLIVASAAMAL